jgi:hypothetical protein
VSAVPAAARIPNNKATPGYSGYSGFWGFAGFSARPEPVVNSPGAKYQPTQRHSALVIARVE